VIEIRLIASGWRGIAASAKRIDEFPNNRASIAHDGYLLYTSGPSFPNRGASNHETREVRKRERVVAARLARFAHRRSSEILYLS
jgi:hypothetical protein